VNKFIFSLFASSAVFADVNIIVDPYFSPYMGAEDLITLHRGIEWGENFIHDTFKSPGRRWYDRLGRIGELVLFWDPANYAEMVVQHEVFGHGYRVRSLGRSKAHVENYHIGAPPPYGEGGGYTGYEYRIDRVTAFESLAIGSAGVEATSILANRLKMHWLAEGALNPKEATLYLYSEHDLTEYVLGTSRGDVDGDIGRYTRLLNRTYSQGHLSVKSLKRQALVNYLDPVTYYSIIAWWRYFISGHKGKIPMIPIGQYGYLPGARLGLTPFGPEYYLENFLVKDRNPTYFYVRYGHFAGRAYWGVGAENDAIWRCEGGTLGLRCDIWRQPHAAYNDDRFSMENLEEAKRFSHTPHDPIWGISASVIGTKKIWSRGSVFLQLGGKTKGYLPGESLQGSLIARIGFSIVQ